MRPTSTVFAVGMIVSFLMFYSDASTLAAISNVIPTIAETGDNTLANVLSLFCSLYIAESVSIKHNPYSKTAFSARDSVSFIPYCMGAKTRNVMNMPNMIKPAISPSLSFLIMIFYFSVMTKLGLNGKRSP